MQYRDIFIPVVTWPSVPKYLAARAGERQGSKQTQLLPLATSLLVAHLEHLVQPLVLLRLTPFQIVACGCSSGAEFSPASVAFEETVLGFSVQTV